MAVPEAHEPVVQMVLVRGRDRRRRVARRTIVNVVSRIGTPRMNSGMNSGAKKKYVWPLNGSLARPPTTIVDAAISRPSRSAAVVAHEDARRMEVVG